MQPEINANFALMAGQDDDSFRIKPGRSRSQGTRVNVHDLPFLTQVKMAVRKAGGNPIGGSGGGPEGEGGRFNAHGRGAKVVASFPRDGGGWRRDCDGRFRSRRVVVKARVVQAQPAARLTRPEDARHGEQGGRTPICAISNATG